MIDAADETELWRSARRGYARLGDILVRQGLISHEALSAALPVARETGQLLGEVLVSQGQLTPTALGAALAMQPDAAAIQTELLSSLRALQARQARSLVSAT